MLTVVFATRNRAGTLPVVLAAFAALHAPPCGWKLLVVDNGSTDATRSVLDKFVRVLPLTVLHEGRPGKSRALNGAVAAFEGDLVVATDDDVLPAPDWLLRLREAADTHPQATMFGGTVQPHWALAPPDWLLGCHRQLPVLFALIERPSGPCDYRSVFGPNMALRRAVFDAGLRFDEAIGPNATDRCYPMGSEWEFTRRLQARGARGWFAAEARVRHIVRPEQLHEAWMLGRAYRNGLGTGLTAPPTWARGRALPGGLPTALLLRCVAWRALALGARLLPPGRARLHARFQGSWFAGLADGTRRHGAPEAPPAAGLLAPDARSA